jgi:hypothetical protein
VLGAATLAVGVGTSFYFRRQERGLPYLRATLHLAAYAAVFLAAVMAVYFVGDAAGLSDLWIAVLEVGLALALVGFIFLRKSGEVAPRAALARPHPDLPGVHRRAVEPVVLLVLVGLDRG